METINLLYGYPELSEQGQKVTQDIVSRFTKQIEKVVNNTLYAFTCNIGNEITSDDSWINIREQMRNALCGYPTAGVYSSTNWVEIRRKILEENREAVVNDIIQDKENEIKDLHETISRLQEMRSR